MSTSTSMTRSICWWWSTVPAQGRLVSPAEGSTEITKVSTFAIASIIAGSSVGAGAGVGAAAPDGVGVARKAPVARVGVGSGPEGAVVGAAAAGAVVGAAAGAVVGAAAGAVVAAGAAVGSSPPHATATRASAANNTTSNARLLNLIRSIILPLLTE